MRTQLLTATLALILSAPAVAGQKDSARGSDVSGTWGVSVAFTKGDIKQTLHGMSPFDPAAYPARSTK